MKNNKYILSFIFGLLIVLTLGGFSYPIVPTGSPIVVIVNIDNPVSSLSMGEVKLYWMRKIKTRWPDINKNIKPVDRKSDCPEQQTFYADVLHMGADDVETYFVTRQYQDSQRPQDKFSSDYEIINFVGSEMGAIGYVNINSLSPDARTKVKVVLTIN